MAACQAELAAATQQAGGNATALAAVAAAHSACDNKVRAAQGFVRLLPKRQDSAASLSSTCLKALVHGRLHVDREVSPEISVARARMLHS